MRIGSSSYWKFQAVGWGSFALINVIFAYAYDKMEDVWAAELVLKRLGIFVLTGAVLTHIMRVLIHRLHTVQKKVEIQLAQLFFISVIFSVIAATLYMKACLYFGLLNDGEWRFADRPVLLIMSGAFYFFINIVIWNLIYFSYHYVVQSRQQQRDAIKLASLIKELELNAVGS